MQIIMVTVSWLLSYKRLRKYFRIINTKNLEHLRHDGVYLT